MFGRHWRTIFAISLLGSDQNHQDEFASSKHGREAVVARVAFESPADVTAPSFRMSDPDGGLN